MDLVCYNSGCGQRFNETENDDTKCQHHPGAPIFHEGYKGWSCCKKKTTDFTEFLSIPGCTRGKHSNKKPQEPEKQPEKPLDVGQIIRSEDAMKQAPPNRNIERPSNDLPRTQIRCVIAASLKSALQKLRDQEKQKQGADDNGTADDEVRPGAPCKNNGCERRFVDGVSEEECLYHPGCPVFHEGYKFWTCCGRRTSDFDEFLKQVGCESGAHSWMKPSEAAQKKAMCRYDWHQTGGFVFISIYAKVSVPEKSYVEANQTSIKACITFNGGTSMFELSLNLHGLIDPEKSSLELMGTKAEIKLKKQEPFGWQSLEYRIPKSKEDSNTTSS